MATQPTIAEMQNIIVQIRTFAHEDNDYNLCRPYLRSLVLGCADVLETVIQARDWEPS